jgi:predicted transcriptional regulator
MTTEPIRVYEKVMGFRVSSDLDARLTQFSRAIGRKRSDVIRHLLTSCLTAYEADVTAIAKIRQEMH